MEVVEKKKERERERKRKKERRGGFSLYPPAPG